MNAMAVALIDRLPHHCHIVNIRRNSYRMRQHRDLWQTLNSSEEGDQPPTRGRRSRKEHLTA